MASRRARLACRGLAALSWSMSAASATRVAGSTAALGAALAGAAGAIVPGAEARLEAPVFATPALPCRAIAWRRFNASSRPDNVALAVPSAACVITYLDQLGLVEDAPVASPTANQRDAS
jgi:hypothetical protein